MSRRIISAKISLFSQKVSFITEFTGSNILLLTYLTDGQWDFQVANLLLVTVNFESCICDLQKRKTEGTASFEGVSNCLQFTMLAILTAYSFKNTFK